MAGWVEFFLLVLQCLAGFGLKTHCNTRYWDANGYNIPQMLLVLRYMTTLQKKSNILLYWLCFCIALLPTLALKDAIKIIKELSGCSTGGHDISTVSSSHPIGSTGNSCVKTRLIKRFLHNPQKQIEVKRHLTPMSTFLLFSCGCAAVPSFQQEKKRRLKTDWLWGEKEKLWVCILPGSHYKWIRCVLSADFRKVVELLRSFSTAWKSTSCPFFPFSVKLFTRLYFFGCHLTVQG